MQCLARIRIHYPCCLPACGTLTLYSDIVVALLLGSSLPCSPCHTLESAENDFDRGMDGSQHLLYRFFYFIVSTLPAYSDGGQRPTLSNLPAWYCAQLINMSER